MNGRHFLSIVFASVSLVACQPQDAASPAATEGAPAVAASASSGAETSPEDILATVGDLTVGLNEFKAAASRTPPGDGKALTLEEKQAVLDRLVTEKILYLQAKKLGVDKDPKVQKVMVNTLLRQHVYSKLRNSDIGEEELRAYFDTQKDDFVVPEKIQLKRIFVAINDERPAQAAEILAKDLHQQLTSDPGRFRELAMQYSEDPFRRRGGDLAWVTREGKPGVPKDVIEKAFTLSGNALAQPFEMAGGYNILQIVDRKAREERTFEQMKGAVLRKVKNEKYKSLYDGYVAQISGDFGVQQTEGKLETVDVTPAKRLNFGNGGPPLSLGGPPGAGMRPPRPPRGPAPPRAPRAPAPPNAP